MTVQNEFSLIVVGAGHAGIEAALAASRLGVDTLVVTTNMERIGYMSCNPSIGGLGKGHMVREIDALGGEMGRAADKTCIQFKRLNARKGPAVRGSRAQCDKDLYCLYMGSLLQKSPHLTVIEGEAERLILDGSRCKGVILTDGSEIRSKAVVITTGTFMNAVMHLGLEKKSGGRVGDRATIGLSDQLRSFGFNVGRLKTGTPPRLYRDSIDWSKTSPQFGDSQFIPFSYRSSKQLELPQIACYLSYTSEQTHEIIRQNLDQSPMFTGAIEGLGPRYCPSIEDKITRFADKDRHQTFLEPEGLKSESIYLQGISTSLPESVQYEFLRTIPGLEAVKMIRPGYAVEYDFIEPTQLHPTLETKGIQNLFLAGQVNGTSGYEEAGAQGLVAGANAALKVLEKGEFILRRDEAYIGVMIDDLISKGTREPYRMMTSRAEHRMVLREDNNLERLTPKAIHFGLLSPLDADGALDILARRTRLMDQLKSVVLVPDSETLEKLSSLGTAPISKPTSLVDFLRRPELDCSSLEGIWIDPVGDDLISEPVEIAVKYSGYIDRQNEMIRQAERLENLKLPSDMCYDHVKGLSTEEREKLARIRPRNLGQAHRISGVNPSAVQALIVYLKGHRPKEFLDDSDRRSDKLAHR